MKLQFEWDPEKAKTNRLLLVAHTDRLEKVRIISARKATKNERRFYEEEL